MVTGFRLARLWELQLCGKSRVNFYIHPTLCGLDLLQRHMAYSTDQVWLWLAYTKTWESFHSSKHTQILSWDVFRTSYFIGASFWDAWDKNDMECTWQNLFCNTNYFFGDVCSICPVFDMVHYIWSQEFSRFKESQISRMVQNRGNKVRRKA